MTRPPRTPAPPPTSSESRSDPDLRQNIDDVQMMLRSLGLADFGYQDQPPEDARPSWAPARRAPPSMGQDAERASPAPVSAPTARPVPAAQAPMPRAAGEADRSAAAGPGVPPSAQTPSLVPGPDAQVTSDGDTARAGVSLRQAFAQLAARAPAPQAKGMRLQLAAVPPVGRPARAAATPVKRDLRSVFGSLNTRRGSSSDS